MIAIIDYDSYHLKILPENTQHTKASPIRCFKFTNYLRITRCLECQIADKIASCSLVCFYIMSLQRMNVLI